jgi:hypothetical protein
VTWTTAPDAQIARGEYQEFALATDALPAAGEVLLPLTQACSDGTVVHWADPSAPGKAQPEPPVPGFTITAATGTGAGTSSAPPTQAPGKAAPVATAADGTAGVLGGAALLLSLFAAGLALLGRRQGRESP